MTPSLTAPPPLLPSSIVPDPSPSPERHVLPRAPAGRRQGRCRRRLLARTKRFSISFSISMVPPPVARPHTHPLFPRRRSFSFWNFVRNITSGAGAVLGTQALLRAVGIGGGFAAAGSASLNWVLKDGLGRLGAIGAATAVGDRYDRRGAPPPSSGEEGSPPLVVHATTWCCFPVTAKTLHVATTQQLLRPSPRPVPPPPTPFQRPQVLLSPRRPRLRARRRHRAPRPAFSAVLPPHRVPG